MSKVHKGRPNNRFDLYDSVRARSAAPGIRADDIAARALARLSGQASKSPDGAASTTTTAANEILWATTNTEDINPLQQEIPEDELSESESNSSKQSIDVDAQDEGEDGFETVVKNKRRRVSKPSQPKKPKIPPIVVDEPGNWQSLIYELKGTAIFTSKFVGQLLQIYAYDVKGFRLLQDPLTNMQKNFGSWP